MARTEVLREWFLPQQVRVNGLVIPAQEAAIGKYQEVRDEWLKDYPKHPEEEPVVTLSPGKKDNQPGYFVRKGRIYKGYELFQNELLSDSRN